VREEGKKVVIEQIEDRIVRVDLNPEDVKDLLESIKREERKLEMNRYERILKASA